ncbi:formate--tetrahydrofolate ligase, partial [Staphylococcus aureus]
ANQVLEVIEQPNDFKFLYDLDQSLEEKIETIVKDIYGGSSVTFSKKAKKQLKEFTDNGWGQYPICMAKTQYSFSDDATALGAPTDFDITIRELEAKTGAGFIVANQVLEVIEQPNDFKFLYDLDQSLEEKIETIVK